MIVEGQVHGGIAQSIAQALYEETVYDDDGQMLTGTLVDYMIPSAAELPHFDLGRTVTPSPTNPLGVKGIGEAGTIAASAAVVNAAVDAVEPPRHQAPRDAVAARARLAGDAEGRWRMIPEAFDYERPGTLDEALSLLGEAGPRSRAGTA